MVYQGYLSLGGVEILNAARTVTYARELLPGIDIQDCWDCGDLMAALEDKAYNTPFVDNPEWFDPDNPATWGFAGALPLSIEGVEDAVTEATITQLIGNGAYTSRPRKTGREVRVTALLLGEDEEAVQAGMSWLRHALETNPCSVTSGCSGEHACFFSACPTICEDSPDYVVGAPDPRTGLPTRLCPRGELSPALEGCVLEYERHLYQVNCTAGPTVVDQPNLSCGAAWQVEFTLYADVPDVYGTPRYVGFVDGASNAESHLIPDIPCVSQITTPIQDPMCPDIPPPPRPPDILNTCIETPDEWRRYQFTLAENFVPEWTEAVPIIRLVNGPIPARQVRLRFWPNPFGRDFGQLDSCDYCGEFVVSYVPPDSTMTIDGVTQQVSVEGPGGSIAPGSHLLYGSDGGPMVWPEISCGMEYTMTIDVIPGTLSDLGIGLCVAWKD